MVKKKFELGVDFEIIDVQAYFIDKEDKKMYRRILEVRCPIEDDCVVLDGTGESAEYFFNEVKAKGGLPVATYLIDYDEIDEESSLQEIKDFLENQNITQDDVEKMMLNATTLWH